MMASSTPLLLPQVNLGNTFGAIFVGSIFAAILFGVGIVQAFIYFQTHRSTGVTFFKLVVLYLCALDALHLAFIAHCIYYYLVTNYANFDALTGIVWSAKLQIVLAMFIVWSIHLLYAYRIWIVNRGRSRALPIIVGIIVVIVLGVVIVTTWEIYQCHKITDFLKMEWSTLLCLGMITFTDIVIASSLVYLFATSRTGFSSTDSFLTKLMVYTINTGCLTSMCSMAALITCAVMPNNFVYMSIEFMVAKLYVNSFLALMNARYYQQPFIDTAELHIRDDVRPLDQHTGGEFGDEKLHTLASQVKVSRYSHDEASHPNRPAQAVASRAPPIAAMMETRSSESSV